MGVDRRRFSIRNKALRYLDATFRTKRRVRDAHDLAPVPHLEPYAIPSVNEQVYQAEHFINRELSWLEFDVV